MDGSRWGGDKGPASKGAPTAGLSAQASSGSGWGAPRPVEVLLDVTVTPPDDERKRKLWRYEGWWWQRGREAVCRYEEQEHATVTVLRLSDTAVTLLRQGEISCRQRFCAGEAGRTWYRTAHGTFPIAWHCRTLHVDTEPFHRPLLAQIRFSYDLELGGTRLGHYEVAIRIKTHDP